MKGVLTMTNAEINSMIQKLNERLNLSIACQFVAEMHQDDAPNFADRIAVWDDYESVVCDEATFRKACKHAKDYDHAWQLFDGR
jgi:hypothetical protein